MKRAQHGKLPPEPVRLVDYDPAWPRLFEEERARIFDAVGEILVGLEHVGSTAVPGLAAKPIIDIMPGLARLEDGERCVEPLERLGYQYHGEYGIPGRLYFNRGIPRTHHLHMVVVGSEFWERHLIFRDYLRAHPEAAAEYERIKRALADVHRDNREAYTEAKTDFVQRIEAAARDATLRRNPESVITAAYQLLHPPSGGNPSQV